MPNTSKRGFASMDNEKQRTIASKGGKAAHTKGTAHEWSSEEARAAGRKGGESRGTRNRVIQMNAGNTPASTTDISTWVAGAGSSLRSPAEPQTNNPVIAPVATPSRYPAAIPVAQEQHSAPGARTPATMIASGRIN